MTSAAEWESLGRWIPFGAHEIFLIDLPAIGAERHEPLLVVHGYPTSSFDFAPVAPALRAGRRVVAVDLLGFGFSDKPDAPYTMALQADVVMAGAAAAGLSAFALLTHDMGDTVGGELLARHEEALWDVDITARVVTNGSIYIEMARLTAGQQFLLSLPDEAIGADLAPGAEGLAVSLAATMSESSIGARSSLGEHAGLICRGGGHRMLARTIRYIEERRRNQGRFTGAIESHPSPLGIVWGAEDPIAVVAMADRLAAARPGAELRILEGVGHYPMVEAPERFAEAVLTILA